MTGSAEVGAGSLGSSKGRIFSEGTAGGVGNGALLFVGVLPDTALGADSSAYRRTLFCDAAPVLCRCTSSSSSDSSNSASFMRKESSKRSMESQISLESNTGF